MHPNALFQLKIATAQPHSVCKLSVHIWTCISLSFEVDSKFAQKNKMLALGFCLQQPCSNAGRVFATSRLCLDYH